MDLFINSSQVVTVNGQDFQYPNYITGVVSGIQKQLNCANMTIVNSFWKIPRVQGARVIGYTYLVAVNTSVPPTPDSLKVLRLKDKSDATEYEVAITPTDNVSSTSPICQFAYLCDGLGGSLPTMPTATIPFPMIQFDPVLVASGTNTFKFAFPSNPLGLLYSIPAPWFNGALAPAYVPAGITTPALFVTWANSNWDDFGTWTSSGNIVTLASASTDDIPVTKAGMQIALTPKAYCFDLTAYSTPSAVNQVKFGTGGTLISVPGFMLTDDPTLLINVLSKVMTAESTTYGTAVAHKLQVNSVYDVPKLYLNGVLVVTSTAAVCS